MKFEQLSIANGIPLFYMHTPHIDTVTAGILVKAGTRHEIWPQEAGIAHALEHMRFQGTQEFPTSQAISAYIEDVGGVINAWTSSEGTFFWQKVPAYEFERMPRLLSQQLLYPLIPEEKIATEMQNIVQEIRQAKDDPSNFALSEFEHLVYSGHVLGRDILGSEESVTSFSRLDSLNFSDRLYLAPRIRVVVVGNIPASQAVEIFSRYLSNIRAGDPEEQEQSNPLTVHRKEKIYKRQIEQVHMILGYPLGPGDSRVVAEIGLFAVMAGGGMSFPLFQIVRDSHGLCYDIHCNIERNRDQSSFYVYIGTDPKKYLDAERLILQVIDDCKKNPSLLERAKSLALGRLAMFYEDPSQIAYQAAKQILYRGKPKDKLEKIEEIKSITMDEIEQSVNEHLREDRLTRVVVGPESLV